MIRCACLLEIQDDSILLVRVRDNDLWYLPGGTIEAGEDEEDTLIRELSEELGIEIDPASILFDRQVIGPALGRKGEVELNCFRAGWTGSITPMAEISDVAFVGFSEKHKMAPAIKILTDQLQQELALS